MGCIIRVSHSVKFEGELMGPITPIRGLSQGDPLSLYLFILYVEGISVLIRQVEETDGIT